MFKQIIFPILLIASLPLLLKLLVKLRLGLVLLYIVLANTLLLDWVSGNAQLSDGILFALVGVTALSWLVTLYQKVAEHFGFSRADRRRQQLLTAQLRAAKSAGVPLRDVTVRSADGLPIVKYND
ncbi:MAG: hypothetical protein RSB53_05400 [Oscillospiraceae bacterium]